MTSYQEERVEATLGDYVEVQDSPVNGEIRLRVYDYGQDHFTHIWMTPEQSVWLRATLKRAEERLAEDLRLTVEAEEVSVETIELATGEASL